MFLSKLADADGEATETQVWLDFARGCEHLTPTRQVELQKGCEEIGRMLGKMMSTPEKFMPLNQPRQE